MGEGVSGVADDGRLLVQPADDLVEVVRDLPDGLAREDLGCAFASPTVSAPGGAGSRMRRLIRKSGGSGRAVSGSAGLGWPARCRPETCL